MRVHALILAGGSGDRFGSEIPKQFVRLAGEPILSRSIKAIAGAGVRDIAVVAHPDWIHDTRLLVDESGLDQPIIIVPGGATRNESTRNGLAALEAADDDIVLIHDAVRPLVPREVIARSIEPIQSGRADATDTVIESADTLVVVEGDQVVEIPPRARFRRGQTPQAFRVGVVRAAYRAAELAGDLTATDDCSLVMRYVPEARIEAVAGDELNLKITTRTDMVLADRMIQMRTLPRLDVPDASASLRGARLYIVGGTEGIGSELARQATESGAQVAVDGRRTGLDVRDYATVADHVHAAADRMGGIDHVICTAGVLRVGRAAEMAVDDLREIIDVNVSGTLNVARASHPYLRASRGSLTLFASSSFTVGRARYVAYSASKAAVVNIAQGLADEWADDGVRVNVVSPERTDTRMRRQAFPTEERTGMLQPDEVARATIRLLCASLTGQVLDVRRGEELRPSSIEGPPDADPAAAPARSQRRDR
jgi:2-C-methyl-D-erythritol 4-phosphate cytidylyltransferase